MLLSLLFLLIQYIGMSKSKLLNVRINPDLKKRAKELAKSDGRSLSNWVIKLIAQEIEKADKKGKVESK